MPTLDEVEKEIYYTEMRAKIAISDRYDVTPDRKEKEYLRCVTPIREKLARLRDRYENAEEHILKYRERIEELGEVVREVKDVKRIKKAYDMVTKINKMVGDKSKAVNMAVIAADIQQLTVERAHDATYLKKGLLLEIDELFKLRDNEGARFFRQEAELLKALAAHDKAWDEYCENIIDYYGVLDRCSVKLVQLKAVRDDLRGGRKLQQMQNKMAQIMELMKLMGPEMVAKALSNSRNSN
jgi:hypothetical protein